MKKVVRIFSLLIVMILIAGCGSQKEVVKTCKLTQTDPTQGYKLESTYTIYGTGKAVDRVETTESITSENQEILDYFETYLKDTYDQTNKVYGGYDVNVTNESGKVVSKVTIDYSKMNLEKYVEDNTSMKAYMTKQNKILVSGMQSLYESLGAICE